MKVQDKELYLYAQIKKVVKKNIGKKIINNIINNLDFNGSKKFDLGEKYDFHQIYEIIEIKKKGIKKIITNKECVMGSNEFNDIKFNNDIVNAIIRIRKPGDIIVSNGIKKKVSRYMIDVKIPKDLRKGWPIIVNSNDDIIYIPKESL